MGFLNDNFIADFFVIAIQWVYRILNEYSLTIIVVALFVRAILLPIDFKQRNSSKKMQALSSEVADIQRRYANNPDQINVRINKLYKDRGVSPMSGCLPVILQIVFLFAFYGALRQIASRETLSTILNAAENGTETVKLTRWLWVNNLWQPDSGLAGVLPSTSEFLTFLQTNTKSVTPQIMGILQSKGLVLFNNDVLSINEAAYTTLCNGIISANNLVGINNGWFILPVLSGAAFFLQQYISGKVNPNPQMDQTMVMMKFIYPVVSFMVCLSSNAMFAIYWTFTSLYGMLVDVLFNVYYKHKEKKEGQQ